MMDFYMTGFVQDEIVAPKHEQDFLLIDQMRRRLLRFGAYESSI